MKSEWDKLEHLFKRLEVLKYSPFFREFNPKSTSKPSETIRLVKRHFKKVGLTEGRLKLSFFINKPEF